MKAGPNLALASALTAFAPSRAGLAAPRGRGGAARACPAGVAAAPGLPRGTAAAPRTGQAVPRSAEAARNHVLALAPGTSGGAIPPMAGDHNGLGAAHNGPRTECTEIDARGLTVAIATPGLAREFSVWAGS
jgi:hypothetical protein